MRFLTFGLVALAALVSSAPFPQMPSGLLLGSSFGIPGQNYTFDYLIVGGGNAGLVVAARLAEDPSLLVGVVEAGSFYELTNGNLSQIPGMDIYYAGKDKDDWQPGVDWGFITTPQRGVLNASVHYPRGKVLGGNSARNYMTYHAGTVGAYDMWADIVGDDSYNYDNFYPYFIKSQNFTPPNQNKRLANATPSYNESALGIDGPLDVIFPNHAGAFGTWVEKGLSAIGINPINGFQNGKLIGSSYCLATIKYDENIRDSSETAFLQPALTKENPNLIVFPLTLAKKILFDRNKTASGVEVNTGGLTYTINVKREVILSAGSFQSPQLLMVSGIGPASLLNQHGIEVLADRPGVGQNMTDHVLFGTTYRVNLITGSSMGNPNFANEAVQQFKQGYGPLVNPNVDFFGWEKLPRNTSNFTSETLTSLAYFSSDWPEIEYIAPSGYFGYSGNYQKNNPTDGYNYATIVAGLVATLSRGSVSISSADAADPPIINPNWLTHPADKASAIASFKRTRDIWESDAMKGIVIGDEYFPGKGNVNTDDEIWTFIQESFSTIFHAACTCQMGKKDDPNAVVDTKARVIGVNGLRVVDASTLPILPPGHPMATIYALAEKISAEILANL